MQSENFEFIYELAKEKITNNVFNAVDIALTMLPYTKSIKEMIEMCDGDKSLVAKTIVHDYIGLNSNDEDFLPRLSTEFVVLEKVS